jgi:hypothetical protein
MQKLFIISYCHPNCTPLQSITRLSETEAYQKAKELAEKYHDTAFGRFADFNQYYPMRICTEKWLYDQFIKLGGQPATEHPLYFVLHKSKYLDKWFSNGEITKLSINDIDTKHISFTFGDSMATMDKPERQDLFLKEDLLKYLEGYNGNINQLLESIRERYTYIEAQLWNDIYIKGTGS